MNRPRWASAGRVALRACAMRLASCALGYPDTKRIEALDACLRALDRHDALPVRLREAVGRMSVVRQTLSNEAMELRYVAVFGHVSRADCNPCEVAYRSKHIFQAAQQLADIQGCYQTYGLDIGHERPDHIAVEWEFMAFLAYREAAELADGQIEDAESMRRAQAIFLKDHPGAWCRSFAAMVRRRTRDAWFVAIADLLDALLMCEGRRLKVPIMPAKAQAPEHVDPKKASPLAQVARPQRTVFHA